MEIATDKKQVRVWVYRSTKRLTPSQEAEIAQRCDVFVSSWASHGNKLAADFKILYNHYIVFFVNQAWAQASGCSIDSSVAVIKEIESNYNLGLLDRMQIGFLVEGDVVFYSFSDLKSLYDQNIISDESIVLDPLVQTLSEYEEMFEVRFGDSRYFSAVG